MYFSKNNRTNGWIYGRETIYLEEKQFEVSQEEPSHDSSQHILERKVPSLSFVQGGWRIDRNPDAPVYEERDPNWAEYCEECEKKKAAWTRAEELHKLCGTYQENK